MVKLSRETKRFLKKGVIGDKWLKPVDFVEKHKLLINKLPICICGNELEDNFNLKLEPDRVRVKCMSCHYIRTLNFFNVGVECDPNLRHFKVIGTSKWGVRIPRV